MNRIGPVKYDWSGRINGRWPVKYDSSRQTNYIWLVKYDSSRWTNNIWPVKWNSSKKTFHCWPVISQLSGWMNYIWPVKLNWSDKKLYWVLGVYLPKNGYIKHKANFCYILYLLKIIWLPIGSGWFFNNTVKRVTENLIGYFCNSILCLFFYRGNP